MVTRKTKLRTDGSLWQHLRTPGAQYRALTQNTQTDVLVIGGGITGAMIAETLAEAGLEVMVVDRRVPVTGSTIASTALVQYEIDTPLLELQDKIGKRDAVRAWRRSRLAVTSLRSFFREREIEAQARDSLYLAGNELGPRDLQREGELRRAAGIETQFLSRGDLRERFGIGRAGALLGFDNLTINPRAAAVHLLVRAASLGARLHAPSEIVEITRKRAQIIATTRDGPQIACRHLVFASGYEFPKMVPMRAHQIMTTWAFATPPQRQRLWPEECLIWEASDPYLYIRTTPDARVICGGEDAEHKDDAGERLLETKIARLQRKLAKLFPGIDTTAEFTWAASFGETTTGLPTIGMIPRHKNCWAALGYGGNGITYSRIAAEILRTTLTGERDPDAYLYSFR